MLNPLSHKTEVLFIRHHREDSLPSNTAQLACHILGQSQILTYGLKDQAINLVLEPGKNYFFLYPSPQSVFLEDLVIQNENPSVLIVPDGAWRQAKKIHRHTEELRQIQNVSFKESGPSSYFLRKEHQSHYLSTFEATARALQILEKEKGDFIYEEMTKLFYQFVLRHLISRSSFDQSKSFEEMAQHFISRACDFAQYYKLDPRAFPEFINKIKNIR